MTEPEIVEPSDQPMANTATGSGRAEPAAAEPVDPEQSAGTGGIGTQAEQRAAGGPPPANSTYDVSGTGTNDTDSTSDSGT